jgi:guanylate kinase
MQSKICNLKATDQQSSSTPGQLVIFSGPSGVGKDTVLAAWSKADPRVQRVVAYTTREPRPGEVDGVDYHFVTDKRFSEMAGAGDFLEYKEVHGNFYATPLKDMERMLADGKVAVLKIDVKGALDAMKLRPDAITIFLEPPSFEVLEDRMRQRGTESEEAIQKRLRNAHLEMELRDHYQHVIANDRIEDVVQRLLAVYSK